MEEAGAFCKTGVSKAQVNQPERTMTLIKDLRLGREHWVGLIVPHIRQVSGTTTKSREKARLGRRNGSGKE